jgi:hypothetical protein
MNIPNANPINGPVETSSSKLTNYLHTIKPMTFTFPNIIQMFSYFMPMFIVFFMILSSVVNQEIQKSLIWLGGASILTILVFLLQNLAFNKQEYVNTCKAFDLGYNNFNFPSPSSAFIMYTIFYIAAPMNAHKDWNIWLLVTLIILFGFDAITKLKFNCLSIKGITVGSLIGALFGIIWYMTIKTAGGVKLLYYNFVNSNNMYCSKPKEQTFKCSVYKNGQLISQQ